VTRPQEQVDATRELHEVGLNSCQISRELNIPRGTIRDWLSVRRQEQRAEADARRARRGCGRCKGEESALGVDYVYLLGLYLGDGCLSCNRRGVWRLRIFQDQRYRVLVNECILAISAITLSRVLVQQRMGCVEIGASWKHWIHLFPQAGPGPKWLRPIIMQPWQQALIDAYPAQLVRGLIHSDGCRSMNRITSRRAGSERQYCYPRYMFTNASDDIRLLFTEACDRLSVRWTQMNARNVAISRKEDVAFLDRFIGPKS
jgi:hypothetical protein